MRDIFIISDFINPSIQPIAADMIVINTILEPHRSGRQIWMVDMYQAYNKSERVGLKNTYVKMHSWLKERKYLSFHASFM